MRIQNEGVRRILNRPGITQAERDLPALQPSSVSLMSMEVEDWLLLSSNFSRFMPFFESRFPDRVVATWRLFFEELIPGDIPPPKGTHAYQQLLVQIKQKIHSLESSKEMQPHLGLLLAFFRLMEFPREELNSLTKRHLDFYFKRLLGFEKSSPTPDRAFLLFEVAKNTSPIIPKGTAFLAGKDKEGRAIRYLSTTDFFPNQAYVEALKSRYTGTYENDEKVWVGQIANSWDGKGGEIDPDEPGWWPFGNPEDKPAFSNCRFGFLLRLDELKTESGTQRYFVLDFEFEKKFYKTYSIQFLKNNLNVSCTGEEGWMELPILANSVSSVPHSQHSQQLIRITVSADEELGRIIPYQDNLHWLPGFSAYHPVLMVSLKANGREVTEFARAVSSNPLKNIRVRTKVIGLKFLKVSNDMGSLQAEKPFLPFGPLPRRGSNFYISLKELDNLNLTYLKLDLNWENFPDDLVKLYDKYQKITPDFFKIDVLTMQGQNWNPILQNHDLFTKKGEAEASTQWEFGKLNSTSELKLNQGLKISLRQSFFHEDYPRLYALAMTKKDPENHIPNEPYTPLVREISLDYASDRALSPLSYDQKDFWHFDDFGYWPESLEIKSKVTSNEKFLQLFSFPKRGGELFVQVKGLKKKESLTLLFQLLEGSENPVQRSFGDLALVNWSVLVNQHWRPLQPSEILQDGTNRMLRSGILRVQLPDDVFSVNSRMEGEGIWLRLSSNLFYDSLSKVIAIHAQAQEVVYDGQNSDLAHLEEKMPSGTISKMETRIAGVKSISQPFNSFGGKPKPSDKTFYIQKSERIRHKNRAITLWDMERMVLDHFPEVFRVKCLNHTHTNSFLAPGHVLVVMIPDVKNNNVHDLYRPSLSQSLLRGVKSYLSSKMSPQVKLETSNPDYEDVKVSVKVRFREGMDQAFYENQLHKDLVGYFSPWTRKRDNALEFGVHFQENMLIHFIEKLYYVDYLQGLVIEEGTVKGSEIVPTTPYHILVSAKKHKIEVV